MSLNMKNVLFLFSLIYSRYVESWGCPIHCFCYKWENMMKTDCGGINLYNTFVGIPHETQVLDLTRNVISILHGNEFLDANLRKLKYLTLSHNRLHKIDKLSFNGLEELEYADLSFNNLEWLTPTTFDYNLKLKVLNVSGNPLKLKADSAFLSNAPSLQIFNVASCSLDSVGTSMFQNLEKLRVLNVSDNRIRKILPETLEGLRDLQYLDVSKNDLTCNDESEALIQWLMNRGIRFQAFCQTRQKLLDSAVLRRETIAPIENSRSRVTTDEKITRTPPKKRTIFEDVTQFFRSIPPLYAVLCGIQVGIFIGVLSTYFCIRKPNSLFLRTSSRNPERAETTPRFINSDPDNLSFALIPLCTAPGTPPSPYHSRLRFPSDYSLR